MSDYICEPIANQTVYHCQEVVAQSNAETILISVCIVVSLLAFVGLIIINAWVDDY